MINWELYGRVYPMLEIYVLDLLGTFAFSVYGAFLALKKKLDLFGIFVCAFLTALGGGTIREIILNNHPFYFFDYLYLVMIILGVAFSLFTFFIFHKINKYMLLLDAVGIVTFAFVGAQKAAEANLGGFAIVFLATVTAVGGGILRDIFINEVPQIFYKDLYATPAIILGFFYFLLLEYISNPFVAYSLLFITFLIRVYAIYYKINLWSPLKR